MKRAWPIETSRFEWWGNGNLEDEMAAEQGTIFSWELVNAMNSKCYLFNAAKNMSEHFALFVQTPALYCCSLDTARLVFRLSLAHMLLKKAAQLRASQLGVTIIAYRCGDLYSPKDGAVSGTVYGFVGVDTAESLIPGPTRRCASLRTSHPANIREHLLLLPAVLCRKVCVNHLLCPSVELHHHSSSPFQYIRGAV
jgi:hypothetical protein